MGPQLAHPGAHGGPQGPWGPRLLWDPMVAAGWPLRAYYTSRIPIRALEVFELSSQSIKYCLFAGRTWGHCGGTTTAITAIAAISDSPGAPSGPLGGPLGLPRPPWALSLIHI